MSKTPTRPVRGPRRASARRAAVLAMVLAATLAGTLGSAPTVQADGPGPALAACPAGLATMAKCYTGRDTNGGYYTMTIPKRWNGSLVVHVHGGPDFAYDASTLTEGLERWKVMVDQGTPGPLPPTGAAATGSE
ncbi:hypothetical protein ACFYRD_38435 [Streptomyces hirsutus]|uniref:hypothetical protein n=1 Tax=Streptomyces hirsutus TaxID=35620 RepID=UPI00367E17EE